MRQRSLYTRLLKLNGCLLLERFGDRLGSVLVKFFAQLSAIISFVAEHAFGSLHS